MVHCVKPDLTGPLICQIVERTVARSIRGWSWVLVLK